MPRELAIDRAIYVVDDEARTYGYLRRNPKWGRLSPAEHEANKRAIEGYTRVFQSGRSKVYRRSEHPR